MSSCPSVFAIFNYTASGLIVTFADQSINAGNWDWDFGDGFISSVQNPTHIYALPGVYTVCLVSTSACSSDTTCTMITLVLTGIDEGPSISSMQLYPNPTEGLLNLSIPSAISHDLVVTVYNLIGEVVYIASGAELEIADASVDATIFSLKLDHLTSGSYLMEVQSRENVHMEQFILSK